MRRCLPVAPPFCRTGADYTGVDITPENIERTRRHLALFGFSPLVQEADAERLPFPDASFDVVFSNGVLHHTPNIDRSFREAHRVLQRGGSFWVLLYHKNSIFHWLSLWLASLVYVWRFNRRPSPAHAQLSSTMAGHRASQGSGLQPV